MAAAITGRLNAPVEGGRGKLRAPCPLRAPLHWPLQHGTQAAPSPPYATIGMAFS